MRLYIKAQIYIIFEYCVINIVIVVSFTQSEYNVSEGAKSMRIEVELNKRSPQRIVLRLVITPITAEGST